MSKTGSSIGIGTIIFWGIIVLGLFDDDDEDDANIEVDDGTDITITEVKQKADEALDKAKEIIDSAKAKLQEEDFVEEVPDPVLEETDDEPPIPPKEKEHEDDYVEKIPEEETEVKPEKERKFKPI